MVALRRAIFVLWATRLQIWNRVEALDLCQNLVLHGILRMYGQN